MRKVVMSACFLAALSGCSSTALNTGNQVNLAEVNFKDEFATGKACETTALFFFGPFGSSSMVDAAKQGDLQKVEVVEQTHKNYVLFDKRCTVVHGKV